MKNLLIISYDFSLEAGGIQNTSYLLAKEFLKYMNVFTLCPNSGHAPNIPKVKTYQSKYANTREQRKLYDKDAIRIVEQIHKEHHIDYVLVLIYSYSYPAYFLKKKYGVPYGIMTHGNEVMSLPFKLAITHPRGFLLTHFYRKRVLDYATNIFSNTYFTKGLVRKITNNVNISVINPPFDMSIEETNLTEAKNKVLLSVGRLVERKGFQDVIRALPLIIKQIPEIRYIIAGSGEYEHSLKCLVKELRLDNYVLFKGRVSESEKRNLFSNCGLFVMPSFVIKGKQEVEGFGISFIEANLYGKFVISSRSGGIPEAIKENETGFLVEEHDIKGFADAVTKFYSRDFHYSPEYCVKWAMTHHISHIARQYFCIISKQTNNKR